MAPGPSKTKRVVVGGCLFLGARPERAFVAPAATTTILFKIVRRGSPGNERRAFLLLCVLCVFCVYDDCVDFCDVTMTHEHRRNALALLGRCPPFRNIETPFCSATLCRTRPALPRTVTEGDDHSLTMVEIMTIDCLGNVPDNRMIGVCDVRGNAWCPFATTTQIQPIVAQHKWMWW